MMTRRVVDEIWTDEQFHRGAQEGRTNAPSSSASSSLSQTATSLTKIIRQKYQNVHAELINQMPLPLAALFFYHLTNAEKEIDKLTKRLGNDLVVDIRNRDGELYRQKQQGDSAQLVQREKLYEYWKQLKNM